MATEKTNDLKTETRAIASIVVGERFREGVGDEDQFKALQESIIDLGVLEPIVVEPDGTLVDGYRRLEACRARGVDQIPVIVFETIEATNRELRTLRAQRDTNLCRLDPTPDEKARLGIVYLEMERAKAKERMLDGRHRADKEPYVRANIGSGAARDLAAKMAGFKSGATFDRAREIIEIVDDESQPQEVHAVALEAIADMRKTGKVTPAFDKLRAARKKRGARGGNGSGRLRAAKGPGKPRHKPDAFMTTVFHAMHAWPREYPNINFEGYRASKEEMDDLTRGIQMLTQIRKRLTKEETS